MKRYFLMSAVFALFIITSKICFSDTKDPCKFGIYRSCREICIQGNEWGCESLRLHCEKGEPEACAHFCYIKNDLNACEVCCKESNQLSHLQKETLSCCENFCSGNKETCRELCRDGNNDACIAMCNLNDMESCRIVGCETELSGNEKYCDKFCGDNIESCRDTCKNGINASKVCDSLCALGQYDLIKLGCDNGAVRCCDKYCVENKEACYEKCNNGFESVCLLLCDQGDVVALEMGCETDNFTIQHSCCKKWCSEKKGDCANKCLSDKNETACKWLCSLDSSFLESTSSLMGLNYKCQEDLITRCERYINTCQLIPGKCPIECWNFVPEQRMPECKEVCRQVPCANPPCPLNCKTECN